MPNYNGVLFTSHMNNNKNTSNNISNKNNKNLNNNKINNNVTMTMTTCTTTTTNSTTSKLSLNNSKLNNETKIKILIFTESFHPYTSGIARRFKEIIERLAKRNFLIHVVTGCKVTLSLSICKILNRFILLKQKKCYFIVV